MRLRRMSNPIRDLSREQKIALGVGAGVVVVFGTIATLAVTAGAAEPPAPKKAIDVGPGCTSYNLDEQRLRDELRTRLRAAAAAGPIDPLQLTARYIKATAPTCPTYPANTQTPAQVQLFAEVYLALLEVMQQDDYLAPEAFPTWYQMMATWAAGQGVAVEDL